MFVFIHSCTSFFLSRDLDLERARASEQPNLQKRMSDSIRRTHSTDNAPAATTGASAAAAPSTIGGGSQNPGSEGMSAARRSLLHASPPMAVRRQRSNPIAIKRRGLSGGGGGGGDLWLSKSMPAPRAPIIGSMTEPITLKQRIPDLALPPTDPKTSMAYGSVGTSMSRISASMPTTSFMSLAAVGARRAKAVHGDSAGSLEKALARGENASPTHDTTKSAARSLRAGSFSGGRTALSVLIEHPSEDLLEGVNFADDAGAEPRVLMEEIERLNMDGAKGLDGTEEQEEPDMASIGTLTPPNSEGEDEDDSELFHMDTD